GQVEPDGQVALRAVGGLHSAWVSRARRHVGARELIEKVATRLGELDVHHPGGPVRIDRRRRALDGVTGEAGQLGFEPLFRSVGDLVVRDRKSTRLNSSHVSISYAV